MNTCLTVKSMVHFCRALQMFGYRPKHVYIKTKQKTVLDWRFNKIQPPVEWWNVNSGTDQNRWSVLGCHPIHKLILVKEWVGHSTDDGVTPVLGPQHHWLMALKQHTLVSTWPTEAGLGKSWTQHSEQGDTCTSGSSTSLACATE